jgi:hypothetical protein
MTDLSLFLAAHRDAIALARATDLDEPGFIATLNTLELVEARRILIALAGMVSTARTDTTLFHKVIDATAPEWR